MYLQAHLHFLPMQKSNEKMQKSLQANAKEHCNLYKTDLRPKRSPAGNSGLA
jgi:hypothetical protein